MNSNLAFRQKGQSVYHHFLSLLFILPPQKTACTYTHVTSKYSFQRELKGLEARR